MKILWTIMLAILVFLAVSSGFTKVLLMQQDVVFFGKYGFSNTMLIVFGAVQLLGGILMPIKMTRILGATLVAVTFLVSLIMLVLEGMLPIAGVTLVAIALLVCIVIRRVKNLD